MANEEITNNDMLDMLKVILERTERIGEIEKKIDKLDERVKINDIKLETDIKPTLQLILENQTEVINQKAQITAVESKQEEIKDRVDVIEFAVKQNQQDIKELKKNA